MHTILYFRRENEAYLGAKLSEESKLKRCRRTRISIQTTLGSWMLELISGGIAMVLKFFTPHDGYLGLTNIFLILLHSFLYFVFIPVSYLLNTEVVKSFINSEGWMKSLRNCCRIPRRVAPVPNEPINMNNIAAPQLPPIMVPGPIFTISGNIISHRCTDTPRN